MFSPVDINQKGESQNYENTDACFTCSWQRKDNFQTALFSFCIKLFIVSKQYIWLVGLQPTSQVSCKQKCMIEDPDDGWKLTHVSVMEEKERRKPFRLSCSGSSCHSLPPNHTFCHISNNDRAEERRDSKQHKKLTEAPPNECWKTPLLNKSRAFRKIIRSTATLVTLF